MEFSKCILGLHQNTTNDTFRAELGWFPMHQHIRKRSLWYHLQQVDQQSMEYKVLMCNNKSIEKVPIGQLVLLLKNETKYLIKNPNYPVKM